MSEEDRSGGEEDGGGIPSSALDPFFPPQSGRAHEVCGSGAAVFAAVAGSLRGGDILWLIEGWRQERINPHGLARFCDPCSIIVIKAKDHSNLLAMAEDGLRAGAVRTVICETTKPLDLTQGRRLQLAAQAGKTLGLFLIPEGMGSHAAETRWHCQPEFSPDDSTRMRWSIIKNKSGTLTDWIVRFDEQAHRIMVVPQTGQ